MLGGLLEQVKRMIFDSPNTAHQQNNDPDGLIGQIEGLFRGRQSELEQQYPNLRPASEDPLGDPADLEHRQQGYSQPVSQSYDGGYLEGQFPGIKPASQDPLGDPADLEQPNYRQGYQNPPNSQGGPLQQQFPGIKPASQDPLGDPADR
jgi:hypothetical protein